MRFHPDAVLCPRLRPFAEVHTLPPWNLLLLSSLTVLANRSSCRNTMISAKGFRRPRWKPMQIQIEYALVYATRLGSGGLSWD